MMQLSNYLFFTTTCEEALAFYAQCGLGRVVEMLRYGDNGEKRGDAWQDHARKIRRARRRLLRV
jgi:uncharacterized glyoxalase superfamily protein PhnB